MVTARITAMRELDLSRICIGTQRNVTRRNAKNAKKSSPYGKETRIPSGIMVAPLWVNRDYLTTINMSSAFWQLSVSSQHMVKRLTLNSYMSLFNLKLRPYLVNKYQF